MSRSPLPGTMSYHLACYRNFTNINKTERAKKIAESELLNCSGASTSDDGDRDGPAKKVKRTTTSLSYSLRDADNENTSSNVLAKCCLICKHSGPIYVTDRVCIRV